MNLLFVWTAQYIINMLDFYKPVKTKKHRHLIYYRSYNFIRYYFTNVVIFYYKVSAYAMNI